MSNKSKHNKKQLIEAMEKSLGVVTMACKMVGVSRKTYYEYYNTDDDFKKEIDDISNIALDFVESQLHKSIKKGSDTAAIFYLKTKGKHRGYIERREVDMDGAKIVIEAKMPDEN